MPCSWQKTNRSGDRSQRRDVMADRYASDYDDDDDDDVIRRGKMFDTQYLNSATVRDRGMVSMYHTL